MFEECLTIDCLDPIILLVIAIILCHNTASILFYRVVKVFSFLLKQQFFFLFPGLALKQLSLTLFRFYEKKNNVF